MITNGKTTITNQRDIANSFNNYFVSIADDILKKRKYEGNISFLDYLKNPVNQSMMLFECDKNEVKGLINSLNPRKGTGPNSIPTKILQLLSDDISEHLCKIFNLSFTTGKHPDILKISKTIPIFKKGVEQIVSNYRPISLLSNINKILEKLMFSRVYDFLERHKSIYNLQFGFRSRHSTNHALIDITENIRQALDDNKAVCGIFLDFQKAFDTVNHEILIRKLNHYGIRGIANNWFSSYLSNRSQYVSISGFESDRKPINHGVPQGSVLGPILFLLYINDLNEAIKYSKVYHFADDTNLLNVCENPKKLQKQINIDLKLLYKWILANKISLNCSKTEFIIFHKPGQNIDFEYKIKMNGHKLIPSEYIKYLGVFLDCTLNGRYHCEKLAMKLRRANGMLSKIRHFVPKEELKSIYHAIFSSHMSYGMQIWAQSDSSHLENISKLQNRAMRIINFKEFDADCNPLYKDMKILKLMDFIALQNCLFVHDFFDNRLPACFDNYFKRIRDIHSYPTLNSELGCLSIPIVSTTRYGLNSITYRCVDIWNRFSRHFKQDMSTLPKHTIKKEIHLSYLNSY